MNDTLNPTELRDCLPGLYRYARSLTRNNDQAHDLVQDSVERALSKAHLFDGANLRAWLATICRRIFLNDIRKQKSRGAELALDDAPPQWDARDAEQDAKCYYKSVVAALDTLSSNDQQMIALITFDGMMYEEAAQLLQIRCGTVRSRLSRARGRLAAAVDSPQARPQAPSGSAQSEQERHYAP